MGGVLLAGTVLRAVRHRLYWRAIHYAQWILRPTGEARVRLADNCGFTFELSDPYWAQILSKHYRYEPEVGAALAACGSAASLIDCGANRGYWTVLNGSHLGRTVVAVEPSSANFAALVSNVDRLGSTTVHCVHAAVGGENGTCVLNTSSHHAGFAVHPEGASGANAEVVRLVTIDSLIEDYRLSGSVVVKLDVEGSEIEALRGASRAIADGAIVLYEDHGRDSSSAVSRFVIDDLRLWVGWLGERAIEGPLDIRAVEERKRRPTVGYNLVAALPESELLAYLVAAYHGYD